MHLPAPHDSSQNIHPRQQVLKLQADRGNIINIRMSNIFCRSKHQVHSILARGSGIKPLNCDAAVGACCHIRHIGGMQGGEVVGFAQQPIARAVVSPLPGGGCDGRRVEDRDGRGGGIVAVPAPDGEGGHIRLRGDGGFRGGGGEADGGGRGGVLCAARHRRAACRKGGCRCDACDDEIVPVRHNAILLRFNCSFVTGKGHSTPPGLL